ncbi:MAG: ABC transporter substrate-binding protein [Clostridia bacterium]|nr:ABC transporter substrate-binding protein [Clostridia bacterium]
MKRIFVLFLSVMTAFTVFAFSACGKEQKDFTFPTITVYSPDGAPALSVAKFINDGEDFVGGIEVKYNVVAAEDIGGIMQQGKGDIIIMPVNAASKLYAAQADKYKMAGVITHGNLYLMAKEDLDLQDLKGKVVGVVNLANVPGLTFKAILEKSGIEYEENDTAVAGKVALRGYDAPALIAALKQGSDKNGVDFGVLPEPAANKLTGIDASFKYALDLQELYNAETKTYPQAAVMVKSSVIAAYPALINSFGDKVASGVSWVKENPELAVQAVSSALKEGLTPSFNANNLNATVVDNCKIYWQSAADAKAAVKAYITEIRGILETSAREITDDFFA